MTAIYRSSDGVLMGTYEYDLWGKPVKTTRTEADKYNITERNPIRYRSYYYDTETGLYYLNARYYDPSVRRFLNADSPAFMGGGDAVSYNLYAYCKNNPVNRIDSSGNWSTLATVGVCVGAALCIAAITVLTCGVGTATLAGAIAAGAAKGALLGAFVGAGGGAVVGYALTGTAGGAVEGAAIGFGAGAVTGAIVGTAAGAAGYSPLVGNVTNSIAELSEKALKHPMNKHMPARVVNQLQYMSKASAEKLLINRTFFNSNWTDAQVREALNTGYREALNNGITTGKYVFSYMGDKITVYLQDSVFKSGWGDYVYTYDEFLKLFGGN